MMENVKTYDDAKMHNAVMSLHNEFMDCKEIVQDDEQLFNLLRLKITQLRFKLGNEITDNLLIKSLADQTKRKEKKMKRIIKTVMCLTIAFTSYGQTKKDSVTIHRFQVQEMLNTIEDLMEWNNEDIFNGIEEDRNEIENYWLGLMRDELINELKKQI